MDASFGTNGLLEVLKTSGPGAVNAGANLIAQQIRSQFRLKLGLYVLATIFLVSAAALVVFAPDGRQTLSAIIAVALVALALGCAGFGTFRIKSPLISLDASTSSDETRRKPKEQEVDRERDYSDDAIAS